MSPLGLVLRLTVLIFATEAAIMIVGGLFIQEHLGHWHSALGLALIDSLLLILVSGVAVYHWIVKPYIAARDDAEHALRVSEERIRGIIDNSPD